MRVVRDNINLFHEQVLMEIGGTLKCQKKIL